MSFNPVFLVFFLQLIGPQFILAIKPTIKDSWTIETEEAWSDFFKMVTFIMKEAMVFWEFINVISSASFLLVRSLRPDHSDGRCNVRNRTDYLWLCADWVTIKAFHENTIQMRTGRLSAISHTSIIVIKSFQVQYLSIIHLQFEVSETSLKYLRYFLKRSKIVHNKIILRKINLGRIDFFFFFSEALILDTINYY